MATVQKINPHLWFAHEAHEAATYYCSIFKNSKMGIVSRYTEAGKEIHKMESGSILTVEFELEGQNFIALNGGPLFKFNESISFLIYCDTQEEIDYYWNKLTQGGDEKAQQCGWLKDKYGLSWQVAPPILNQMLRDQEDGRAERVMEVMMKMKKIDIKELEKAYRKRPGE